MSDSSFMHFQVFTLCLCSAVHLYICLTSLTMVKQKTAVLLRTVLRPGGRGWGLCVCIISEHAQSSGHCHDCPRWLRSPLSGAALQCRRTLTAVTSPFSHSPVPSLELLPPAGHLSLVSTSSVCSGTTPSPAGRQLEDNVTGLSPEMRQVCIITYILSNVKLSKLNDTL